MTERSKNRKGYDIDLSCSNSEDADDDPDYIVRFSSRLSKENNSASFNENRRMKIDEEDTTSSSISRKRGRPPKRRNFRQDVQKLEIRMKGAEGSSNVSRRCRNSKRAVHQGRASISSWMINLKALQENQRVVYMDRKGKEPIKEGTLRRDGILCLCCYEVYTAENFQVHAGGKPHKPYEYIFVVDKRVSSVSCMIEAWNMPEESARRRVNEIETKGSAGDPYDDACMICADGDHWECNQERRPTLIDVNSTPSPPFCDQSCKEVKEKLGKIVGEENKLADGYTWTLLQRTDSDPNVCPDELYRGTICNSKLGVAWRLINECFEPLIDRHTSVDMVQSVVYSCGSNFKRINFKSFYTAVLEKDDEIISVASLRFIQVDYNRPAVGSIVKAIFATARAICNCYSSEYNPE
ncbi:hypothetical protein RJ639_038271 [Escallonia herrerae]|uniref:Tify domain-containing protein n=1 Tax=Escallonia herrerae TaxID=1293975 RepID=A0AA89BAF1_9ASTE|nr:hypothetical protein RJ639_038271 [Escallonia herrerae]